MDLTFIHPSVLYVLNNCCLLAKNRSTKTLWQLVTSRRVNGQSVTSCSPTWEADRSGTPATDQQPSPSAIQMYDVRLRERLLGCGRGNFDGGIDHRHAPNAIRPLRGRVPRSWPRSTVVAAPKSKGPTRPLVSQPRPCGGCFPVANSTQSHRFWDHIGFSWMKTLAAPIERDLSPF